MYKTDTFHVNVMCENKFRKLENVCKYVVGKGKHPKTKNIVCYQVGNDYYPA